jgi:hypothetical protein
MAEPTMFLLGPTSKVAHIRRIGAVTLCGRTKSSYRPSAAEPANHRLCQTCWSIAAASDPQPETTSGGER